MRDIYENFDTIPKNSKLAIWGITKGTGEIFCETLNRRIPVSYFVDPKGDFQKKDRNDNRLMGKPVVSKENLLKELNVFVLAEKNIQSEELEWLENHFEGAYYLCEASEIDSAIRNGKSIYLYGAGSAGRRTYKLLEEKGITINAFVDSDVVKQGKRIENKFIDAAIYGPAVLQKDDIVVVSTIYYHDIIDSLLKTGIPQSNIFIDIRNSEMDSIAPLRYKERVRLWFEYTKCRAIKSIDWYSFFTRICLNDKKIILYGVNEFTNQFISLFELLNKEVIYCVDNNEKEKVQSLLEKFEIRIDYKELWELAYEDMKDKLVFVAKKEEKYNGILDADYTVLEKMGIVYLKEMRQWGPALECAVRLSRIEPDFGERIDNILGYTWIFKKTSLQYPGYIVLGNEEKAKKRILILGNSTSDVGSYEYFIKSWPEFLQESLEEAVIFCGAVLGYDSKKELLKLLRDGRQLNLDLVISYSGYMDIQQREGFPFSGNKLTHEVETYGVETNTSLAEEWIESEKMMKMIADSYGAAFVGIFQPVLFNKLNMSFEERVIYEMAKELPWMTIDSYKQFQADVKRMMRDIPYLYDFTDLFCEENAWVFMDECHLLDKGNCILADAIYQLICKTETIQDMV